MEDLYRDSETLILRNPEIQRFTDSETQILKKLMDSEIPGLRDSETQRFRSSFFVTGHSL